MNIHQSIVAIMGEVGAIEKSRTNSGQGYKFRGIDDFMDACHPLFAKHGVYLTSSIKSVNREERQTKSGGAMIYTNLIIAYTFTASDGSSVTTELAAEGQDSGDKSTNKALSAALKYALAQMLLVPYGLIDSEKDSPEIAPKPAGVKWAPAGGK